MGGLGIAHDKRVAVLCDEEGWRQILERRAATACFIDDVRALTKQNLPKEQTGAKTGKDRQSAHFVTGP